jgi:glycosyltransferase involved in cell wall biosynthesis
MARPRLGLIGFRKQKWASLERTRSFYLYALEEQFRTASYRRPIQGTKFDAVLSFSGRSAWLISSKRRFPVILSLHGGAVIDQDLLYKYLPRLKTTDALIVNCSSDEAILNGLLRPGHCPLIRRLPLPIDLQQFRAIGRARAREALPFPVGEYVIGYVARLLPQKALHQFLRIFSELKARVSPRSITAIITGDFWEDYPVLNFGGCSYRLYISNLIKELNLEQNITYLRGGGNDTMLSLCYCAMDVLLHPTNSIDENFGYVPLEAMACGTPVVGAAYGGLKDTVISGHTGFLMPTWLTPSGIRMDMIQGSDETFRILTNPELRALLSRNAISHVRANYSHRKCSRSLCKTVAIAIDRKRLAKENTLSVRPLISSTAMHTHFLPETYPPWEAFLPSVERYVSHPVPRADLNTLIKLAAPIRAVGDKIALDDPAWPASFQLTDIPIAELGKCQTPISVRDFTQKTGISLGRVQHCIDIGLLVSSYAS